MVTKQNNYAEFVKDNKILKSAVNGLYRFLVMWIIKYHKSIHGYAIMKELDRFFENLIDEGVIKKSNPSKIYPILGQMEDYGLISSILKPHKDKEIKFYHITEKGEFFLKYIFDRFILHEKNDQWKLIYEDLSNDYSQ